MICALLHTGTVCLHVCFTLYLCPSVFLSVFPSFFLFVLLRYTMFCCVRPGTCSIGVHLSPWMCEAVRYEVSDGMRGARIAQWYSAELRAVWSGVRVPAEAGNFSLHHRVQNGSGTHPASYPLVPGALSLGVKRPGREADHLPPSSAEVKEYVQLYLHTLNTPS
jgi:hypothetical protein